MPQNPYNAQNSVLTTTGGQLQTYDITTTTLIKGSAGRLFRIVVNAASTTALLAYDSATTGGAGASNLIYEGPTDSVAGTVVCLEWPCANGIVINPGTGGNVSVSYL
jgi:hypothetical protein